MKAFLVYTSTGDKWELCGGSYLVVAESADDVRFSIELPEKEKITGIEEINLAVKSQVQIQEPVIE